MTKSVSLKWGDDFGVSEWAQYNHKGLYKGKREGRESESERELEDAAPLALKIKEGAMNKGAGCLQTQEKARKTFLLQNFHKEHSFANTLLSDLRNSKVVNLCCYKAMKFALLCYNSNRKLIHHLTIAVLAESSKYVQRPAVMFFHSPTTFSRLPFNICGAEVRV